jgi:hypothetical protein
LAFATRIKAKATHDGVCFRHFMTRPLSLYPPDEPRPTGPTAPLEDGTEWLGRPNTHLCSHAEQARSQYCQMIHTICGKT